MGIQQALLQKLGETLVVKFRASIEPVKASGRTAASIHAVATDTTLEVLAHRSIGTLEYGRAPTSSGAPKGNPSLFEAIKEWALIRGIISNINDRKEMGIVYAITKKIHNEGTLLYKGTDHYGRTKPTMLLQGVVNELNYDVLLREIVAYNVTVYESAIIKELTALK
jgi:hypothetical protein